MIACGYLMPDAGLETISFKKCILEFDNNTMDFHFTLIIIHGFF